MEYSVALEYYMAIDVIEAQNSLVSMNVSMYPQMKNDSRKQYFKNMKRVAYPPEMQKQTSFEDFIKKVKNGQ